ncbi:MAG TPA: phosphogluconate dehydratase [Spongiibacteraceae bacterium]|nr:phosphogluconate dehydratase [Spongiibacteraceae bacterium]HCS27005.1 phosphogluconate dehydratase [Spongiibacteraceae bacterium]
MHATVTRVTERILKRSDTLRKAYLARCETMRSQGPQRGSLSCSNLAHGFAACGPDDKQRIRLEESANLAIVSAYNDMLSAHKPLEHFPDTIRDAARAMGCTAQFAGGVPAMCDGVTQGTEGMELSLFSRDTIARATAIALSHNMFDAAICLGVCDKIVPGLLIGALSFGHLPFILVPAGPMASGLPNKEKARIRELYAQGKIGREALLEAESQAYHGEGTCTFYGTANSNQMLMEAMGLHVPGSAFVPPNTPLRTALTIAATERACRITALGRDYTPISKVVNEKSLVNAIVTLLATGGSTNHSIHWIAIARAAGFIIDWQDFAELSAVTPSLTRIYPNGQADVNHFRAAGGTGFVIRELIGAGLLHNDVATVWGNGLTHYTREPLLKDEQLSWQNAPVDSADTSVLQTAEHPFQAEGGLRLLTGNLGRSVIKTSAVDEAHWTIEAPAKIFDDQSSLKTAFDKGELERDFVAVVRYQGPSANGMPELHKLTPYLGILQDKGFKVALVTDGRMSGASGKVPAAIHLYPEAQAQGDIAKLRDGDIICLDAKDGSLNHRVDDGEWAKRSCEPNTATSSAEAFGRELFMSERAGASTPETGAISFGWEVDNAAGR